MNLGFDLIFRFYRGKREREREEENVEETFTKVARVPPPNTCATIFLCVWIGFLLNKYFTKEIKLFLEKKGAKGMHGRNQNR